MSTSRPPSFKKAQAGEIGCILAWILGVPMPILIVTFLLRGCT